MTGQYASVDENLTATENLWLFARLQGCRAADARATAGELLEQFGLDRGRRQADLGSSPAACGGASTSPPA